MRSDIGSATGGAATNRRSLNGRSLAFGAELALLTDLYELTMAQAYWRDDHRGEAVFSLFFRKLPAAPFRGGLRAE